MRLSKRCACPNVTYTKLYPMDHSKTMYSFQCPDCGMNGAVSGRVKDCLFEARLRGIDPWLVLREREQRGGHAQVVP